MKHVRTVGTKTGRPRTSKPRTRLRVPPAALLVLALAEAAIVIFITWPSRATVLCEQMPELLALAACAAVLFLVSVRALGQEGAARAFAGSAAVLAALALFVSVHYVKVWHGPCTAVQHQLHGSPR